MSAPGRSQARRRHWAYAALIALLVLGNLLRWGVTAWGDRAQASAGAAAFEARDFELRANVPAPAEPRRNLFAPQAAMQVPAMSRAAQRSASVRTQAAPPPVPSEASSATGGGLERLRLLGVVFREGRGQAYLALDKTSVIAQGGDTVFGRYAVDRIGVDAVELRDLNTHNTRKIPVSGR